MRKFLPLGLVLALLTACTVHERYPEQPAQIAPPAYDEAPASSSSATQAPAQTQEVVLVDRTYVGANGKKGREWLDAVGAVLVQGHIRGGLLQVELTRGEKLTGWSAVGMYLAEVGTSKNGNAYPDETRFGTRLHFINAEWRGDCARHLAPSSSFGVLKEHSNSMLTDVSAVPVTRGDDGCTAGMEDINLAKIVNDGGLFLAFAPSDETYHVKVTLRYVGDITVTPF